MAERDVPADAEGCTQCAMYYRLWYESGDKITELADRIAALRVVAEAAQRFCDGVDRAVELAEDGSEPAVASWLRLQASTFAAALGSLDPSAARPA